MNWKIIKETKREFADNSYYLKSERTCSEGILTLELEWCDIMYSLTISLFKNKPSKKSILNLFSRNKPEYIYESMIFYNDRVEKYGHQIMRITEDSPIKKLKRLNSLQKDGVLNYTLSEKYNINFKTTLPEK